MLATVVKGLQLADLCVKHLVLDTCSITFDSAGRRRPIVAAYRYGKIGELYAFIRCTEVVKLKGKVCLCKRTVLYGRISINQRIKLAVCKSYRVYGGIKSKGGCNCIAYGRLGHARGSAKLKMEGCLVRGALVHSLQRICFVKEGVNSIFRRLKLGYKAGENSRHLASLRVTHGSEKCLCTIVSSVDKTNTEAPFNRLKRP